MDDPRETVNEAIKTLFRPDELVVCWVLVSDVVRADGTRFVAHRAGGGHDGTERPMTWTALGMLSAAEAVAKSQILGSTEDAEDEGSPPD